MNICVMGTVSPPDEARRVIAGNLVPVLARECNVLLFDLQRLISQDEWKNLRAFQPDIIQAITSASPFSLLLARILKGMCRNAKSVVMSPLIPFRGFSHDIWFSASSLLEPAVPFMKPDLILTQSKEAEVTYRRLGCRVLPFIYSGVDLRRFRPASRVEKEELRIRYHVELDRFVVLHVGSVRKWRNVECLKKLQEDDENQVLLVGRSSTPSEHTVGNALKEAGVLVSQSFNPSIEDFYRLADCYVFPTTDPAGSIDIPLSVLEALASGLPVISTRFGGLPDLFDGEGGLYYAEVEEFPNTLKAVKAQETGIRTRDLVLPYSWENIGQNLLRIYAKMLE